MYLDPHAGSTTGIAEEGLWLSGTPLQNIFALPLADFKLGENETLHDSYAFIPSSSYIGPQAGAQASEQSDAYNFHYYYDQDVASTFTDASYNVRR